MRNALFVMFLASGCGADSMTETVTQLEQRAASVNTCCEIDRSSLGREDHLVRLGSKVVLVHDWVAKPGAPGEYIGFSMTVSNGAKTSFLVKAETQMYSGANTSWSSPGERAIEGVNMCQDCDSPDGCEDGGEGDGGDGGDGGGGYDDSTPPGGGGGGGDGDGDGDGDGGGDGGGGGGSDPACPGGDCPTNGGGWDGPL
jgi:hypothetical protein